MRKYALIGVLTVLSLGLNAQPDRWQQRVRYDMEIDFSVARHQFDGKQRLVYYNNSPDSLDEVFYHLYFNAFQPGSMMDIRSRTIADPDPRVRDRISRLGASEIGYLRVESLLQDGREVAFETVGTILEVTLAEPIAPGDSTVFDMAFAGQAPLQIRRSGRDNREGIAYSMSQWYPKMCEYDYQGWHANPYVGREFYGVWGDFDVTIRIDQAYTVAATGYLQNPEAIGHGYADAARPEVDDDGRLSWHFFAPNVHDFVWAADPDYRHKTLERKDGTVLHFFYQPGEATTENWEMLPPVMDRAFDYINEHFGQYPYRQYSFIQGGDGGMEYPMATLITGERVFSSLVGVCLHELMHSWYQMMLGTNESLYPWMDEGFTNYAEAEVDNFLRREKVIPGKPQENPQAGSYAGYFALVESGLEEPMSTHADHYVTNFAYGRAAYSKGAVFLRQLGYIVGRPVLDRILLKYYDTWRFKHPNSNDFIRIAEKESNLELDWYREYWVNTTHTIDYAVQALREEESGQTEILLTKQGVMPMPVDLLITYRDGREEMINIPLRIMRGAKQAETTGRPFTVARDWPWTHPYYALVLPVAPEEIARVAIDPSGRMADIDPENNIYENK